MSKERAVDDTDEDLVRSIFQLTLEDRTQNGRVIEAIQVASRFTSGDTTIASREHSVVIHDQASEDYRRLYLLDIEMHARLRNVTNIVNQLHSSDGQQVLMMLTEEHNWMNKVQQEVRDMRVNDDPCNEELRHAFLQSLHEIRNAVGSIVDVLGRRTKEDLNSASAIIDTGPNFRRRFHNANPAILLTMLIALILNVFGHVTRPWCNAVLGLLNLLLETTLGKSTSRVIPSDIRTIRKKFDLDPITRTFATCTRCSCTYPPVTTKKKSQYPERCTYVKYRGSMPCGQLLVKRNKGEELKSWAPVRPYVVQDFNAFLAGLLSRPGIEQAMDRGTMMNEEYHLWDIKDGTVMQEVLGPDGEPFMDGLMRKDLRLAWSLSTDWFNPHGNKTSGKKKSVGSIAMGLLNLPPSLRYKTENMYLVGVIPGPREPALEEINHFLRPVIEFFLPSWKEGTWFTRTHEHAEGRLSRSVIAVAINDLPAARKLSGRAGPTANQMCGLCWLNKSEIANFDYDKWKQRTCEEHRAAAEEWKNAETKSERTKIFRRHGVRWSELLRLPYWDPVRFVVIDGMHNLFLGVVQHHFRNLIIVDKQANKANRKPGTRSVDPKELDKGKKILESNRTASAMTRLRLPVLQALLQEAGITLSSDGRDTKMKMIEALLAEPTYIISINDEDRMEVDNEAFVTEELVTEYAVEAKGQTDQKCLSAEALTDWEINAIQAELSGIIRPSWHRGPPKNLGDAEHGKLKAEQWRTAIEFDLPVTLVKLWGTKYDGDERRPKLAHSTMLLAMAIRWGTSHVTSPHHTQQYGKYMKAYLECIWDVFPGHSFRPNHHACLHLHEFLLRYGPMHGWWMFPFERIIGGLQKTNTNHKIGELETTMLETFCAAASVKAMLQEPGAPDVVNKAVEILQRCCPPFAEGFRTDIGILRTAMQSIPYVSHNDANVVKAPVSDVLRHILDKAVTHLNGNDYITEYKRLDIGGLQYSGCNYSTPDSRVFFLNTSKKRTPGVIEHIFSVGQDHDRVYFMAIRGYSPVPAGYEDPFLAYSDFGAQIWKRTQSGQLDIVEVCTSELCHAVSMPWGTSELVLKPMNRDFGNPSSGDANHDVHGL